MARFQSKADVENDRAEMTRFAAAHARRAGQTPEEQRAEAERRAERRGPRDPKLYPELRYYDRKV
jgi:hypothetical protein